MNTVRLAQGAIRILFTGLLITLAGCASSAPTPQSPAEAWAARIRELPSPEASWEGMSPADKQAWMAAEVLPFMRELFRDHDEARFADFDCASCHGSDMAARGFAMPNPEIMALPRTGTPAQRQMLRDHPEILRLMFSRVVPAMERLLGAAPFDEETGEGFSCFTCHPRSE